MSSLLIAQEVCAWIGKPSDVQVHGAAASIKHALGGETLVIVEGEPDTLSWIGQHRFIPKYFKGLGLLHSGFGTVGVALWETLKAALPPTGLVTFTGYAGGAAIAQVVAACCRLENPERMCRAVGFGSPRLVWMTNYKFNRLLRGANSFLYARVGDPVTEVPVGPMYQHALTPVKLGDGEEDDFIPTAHSMDRYCEDLSMVRELLKALAKGRRTSPDEIYGTKNAPG